ncbi:MAG TPA: gamma-glutamyl-gamma-aminobutyrate hydrolase family protein [bacterium]|nr:gamma-glutamyl-gamma-aminobutyrate hydrolase family protein [bacterium]
MVRVMVCQHVGYELLGTLNPLFKEAGIRLRYVNFGRSPEAQPEVDGYDGLVLLGGPMNVDEEARYPHLSYEVRMIEQALKRDIPVLGICLGSQLVAKALGSKVERNLVREIGWHEVELSESGKKDPLLRHFKATESLFHWHGDTFELPHGAEHLASSRDCRNQAFRYGDKAYGFQFHLECDEPMIERWLMVPQHQSELDSVKERTCPERIRKETPDRIGRLKELSRATFGEFLKLFGEEKRFRCPPSR